MVPKPGQTDQWRCIADMQIGRQKQACAADPVHNTCPEDILPLIYPGRFSSGVDASTYSYIFLTVDEERQFIGMIQTDTDD
jgi:hypothetical protein